MSSSKKYGMQRRVHQILDSGIKEQRLGEQKKAMKTTKGWMKGKTERGKFVEHGLRLPVRWINTANVIYNGS